MFIYASKNQQFFEFLVDLKNNANCGFTTIPSVLFEYTRTSTTPQIYAQRTDFVVSLVDNINSMTFINNIPDFSTVMAKVNGKNKSYTDFLLAACLYQYRESKAALLTTDIKGFPTFFERTQIVSVEHTNEIVNFGVFQFNRAKYASAARSTLEEVNEGDITQQ